VKRSKFLADLREANLAEAGDILIPIQEGAVTEDHIYASLGEIVIGANYKTSCANGNPKSYRPYTPVCCDLTGGCYNLPSQ
jgi:hypothetical protein